MKKSVPPGLHVPAGRHTGHGTDVVIVERHASFGQTPEVGRIQYLLVASPADASFRRGCSIVRRSHGGQIAQDRAKRLSTSAPDRPCGCERASGLGQAAPGVAPPRRPKNAGPLRLVPVISRAIAESERQRRPPHSNEPSAMTSTRQVRPPQSRRSVAPGLILIGMGGQCRIDPPRQQCGQGVSPMPGPSHPGHSPANHERAPAKADGRAGRLVRKKGYRVTAEKNDDGATVA